MVGFDVQERNRRRDGMERQVSNMDAATRTVARGTNVPIVRQPSPEEVDSNRRLSRELEEGFRDDSDDEGDDSQLTTGRPTNTTRR